MYSASSKWIEQQCAKLWASGRFHRKRRPCQILPRPDIDWVPYEFMRAQVFRGLVGDTGELLVDFSADSTEDNHLHIHPESDRVITVVDGDGYFIARREEKLTYVSLGPGSVIFMPRGVEHTFVAGKRGMRIHSVHSPFQRLDDESTLVPTDTAIDLTAFVEGKIEIPEYTD